MKKVAFSLGGRRFEMELESEFALYVEDDLTLNGIATDRDNELTKLLRAYLKAIYSINISLTLFNSLRTL